MNINPLEIRQDWIASPLAAFLCGLAAYGVVLGLIAFQNHLRTKWKRRKKGGMLILVNIELLLFFCFFYYVLGAQRIFNYLPILGHFQILPTMLALGMYLVGILVFHSTSHVPSRSSHADIYSSLDYAMLQVRLILPFSIPFLLFTFILDLYSLYSFSNGESGINSETLNASDAAVLIGGSIAFMILIMIFLPFFIQSIWKCKPMDNKELEARLEKICLRAKFKHAGMKVWTIMHDSLTAGILGIIPRFRYVMFTKRLLKEFSPESLEAILAHEIGHSYRKHLLIYPFIIMGMLVCAGLFSILFSKSLINFLLLENHLSPSFLWSILDPFFLFLSYAVIFILYFRFVFGYFSRQFERQADLHVYELNVPPAHLVQALDHVAVATGYSHRVPSWHHFSIQQRIDFLKSTMESPQKIAAHHRFTYGSLLGYLLILILGILLLAAPLLDHVALFRGINHAAEQFSEKVNQTINQHLYQELAKKTIIEYGLKGNNALILDTLVESFHQTGGTNSFPIEGYYASKMLLEKGEISASATLLAHVWKNLTPDTVSPEFIGGLNQLNEQILSRISQSNAYPVEAEELKEARLYALKKFIHTKDQPS